MYAVRAAIPPGPLSDEIQKVQRGWISAGKRTNPKDLYENIPVMFPKTYVLPGLIVPALGRFPIKKAQEEHWPEITNETWYKIALVVASNDNENFFGINALCNQKLGTTSAVPALYASTYLQAPTPPLMRPPPPPPPPPPKPQYFVQTTSGIHGFAPDAVLTFRNNSKDDELEEC